MMIGTTVLFMTDTATTDELAPALLLSTLCSDSEKTAGQLTDTNRQVMMNVVIEIMLRPRKMRKK